MAPRIASTETHKVVCFFLPCFKNIPIGTIATFSSKGLLGGKSEFTEHLGTCQNLFKIQTPFKGSKVSKVIPTDRKIASLKHT